MDKIFLGRKLIAIHVRRFPDAKTTPVSSPDGALQFLLMKRGAGDVARLHRHMPRKRVTKLLQECLIVIKGKIRYDLFSNRRKRLRSVFVRAGEALLILGGAHEVHFFKDSLVYELKNGPYRDDKAFL
ncbi:MAG: hypothetical protein HYS57_00740 [Parcubacteria group bacterium]|nr:hypothetical protein [Parcubacteria group bacterium]